MFLRKPGEPSNSKKAVYLSAATILGVLLSFIAHALVEINYLRWMANQNLLVPFFGDCALSPWLKIGLLILGAVSGFFLGCFWWRKIYIEKIWSQKWK